MTNKTTPPTSTSSTLPLPPIVHAFGGSIGSALAILTFYPLERIRVEIQSQHQQQHEPVSNQEKQANDSARETILQCLIRLHKEQSLYRGAKNMAMTLMISNFIFFYALQVTRKSLTSLHHKQHDSSGRQRRHRMSKSLSSLLASTLAGVVNVLLTNPMWVASLRIMESKSIQQLQRKNCNVNSSNKNNDKEQANLWNVMRQIATEEGPIQLWNGTFTSLLLVSNPIIQHFLYGQMRVWLLSLHRRRLKARDMSIKSTPPSSLTAAEAFVLGAISKMVATVATYPLQLAQVLLRLQSKDDDNTDTDVGKTSSNNKVDEPNKHLNVYNGMIDCLQQQFTQGGIRGLFQGMNAKLLSTVLTAAFTFLSYEQTLLLVGKMHKVIMNDVV